MDVYLGMIISFAFNWAPMGFCLCNGTILTVQQYQALYALIGVTYGGSANTNFQVPDLRSRTMRGLGQGTGLDALNWGSKGGVLYAQSAVTATGAVTLTADKVPGHTHPATLALTYGTAPAGTPPTIQTTLQANPGPLNATTGTNAPDATHTFIGGSPAGGAGATMWATNAGSTPTTVGGVNSTVTNAGTPGGYQTVTGGTVSVNANSASTTTQLPVSVTGTATAGNNQLDPWLAMNFSIAVEGLWPQRP